MKTSLVSELLVITSVDVYSQGCDCVWQLSEWSKSDEKLMKAVEGQDAKKVSSILSKKSMVPSKLGPRGHSM